MEIKQSSATESQRWERTEGKTVTNGLTFRAEIPIFKASIGREYKLEFSESETQTWGTANSKTVTFRNQISSAVANPGQRVVCENQVIRYRVEIPFTMTWSTKTGTFSPFGVALYEKTEGVFTGSYYSRSKKHCNTHFEPQLSPKGECPRSRHFGK